MMGGKHIKGTALVKRAEVSTEHSHQIGKRVDGPQIRDRGEDGGETGPPGDIAGGVIK